MLGVPGNYHDAYGEGGPLDEDEGGGLRPWQLKVCFICLMNT
jgi:hypothetical protein